MYAYEESKYVLKEGAVCFLNKIKLQKFFKNVTFFRDIVTVISIKSQFYIFTMVHSYACEYLSKYT